MMTREESRKRCRTLFLADRAAGRVFYAVNKPYHALLRCPTVDELANGIETQESIGRTRVSPAHIIIVCADESWSPVVIRTTDGRTVIDQWASGRDSVRRNFDFKDEPRGDQVVRSTAKPGRPHAYILLTQPLETMHGRGPEKWEAGSYMLCWNERKLDQFASISQQSFNAMKEPADERSAGVLARLLAVTS